MRSGAIFLDRDGTIIEDSHYVGQLDRVIVIPGAAAALKRLQDAGYRLFIVTNQSGVARGYFPRSAVDEIHAHLDAEFGGAGVRFERYYICPHHPEDKCACRKPQPKHLLDAAAEQGVDLARSFMIGDRASDIQAGQNAGARTILVLTGAGRQTRDAGTAPAEFVATDLAEAVDWILEQSSAMD